MKVLIKISTNAGAQLNGNPRTAASVASIGNRASGRRFYAHLRGSCSGQALVEIALAAPLLLVLVLGVFSISMGVIVYEQLGEAAFAGDQAMSQYVNVQGADLCAKAYEAVTTVLSAPAWPAAQLNQITYSATLSVPGGSTTNVPASTGSFSCPSYLSDLGDKGQATLTLSYPYKWMPIFGLNMGTTTMTRQQSVLAQ
jgi:Flp pilus assembly protein TadG